MRKTLLMALSLTAALVAIVALPGSVSAAVVPGGNSAASQYTETFPTSGGNAEMNTPLGSTGKSPSKVLGQKTAKALEAHGEEGEIVASLATEAAPAPESSEAVPAPKPKQPVDKGKGKATEENHQKTTGGQSGGGSPGGQGGGPTTHRVPLSRRAGSPSSGVSQVLGQLTGSDSGKLGLFLPFVLLAGLGCATAFVWRRRQNHQRVAS